jgi:predicted site-specific integrase-resolvase
VIKLKSHEVLSLLKISRPTLTKYVKTGIVKVKTLPNGLYDYDKQSVMALFNDGIPLSTYIYARVSTPKQKADLENQIELLKRFCFERGYSISEVFSDMASGIDFEKRKDFFAMIDKIIDGKCERVVISYRDRLSRIGFGLFKRLFERFNCEIVVMSEVGSKKLDSEEIFEEIVSLLHCYSMKLYSKRKIPKIREVIADDVDEPDDSQVFE